MIDVPGQLWPVLEAIRTAPSAHNTQPWQLRLTSAGPIEIGPDPDRWLSVADPHGEHLGYSLGCAVEAAHSVARVEYEPRAHEDPLAGAVCSGVLRWRGPVEECRSRLEVLRQRRTHRGPFARTPPDVPLLRTLESLVQEGPVELQLLTERSRIRRMARLTSQGAAACLRDPDYLRELLDWMRVSKEERIGAEDGFTPETLQLDPVTAGLVGWLKRSSGARRLAVRAGLPRAMGLQAGGLLRHSGALLLLTHTDRSFPGFVSAGRILMRLWLCLAREGWSVQPVHFPLTFEETRREALEIFGAEASRVPVTLIRIGRARSPAPASERLPLERICTVESRKERR
ncbi:MAG: hypothetical protein ACE5IL_13830 [Myxococcota bacterium]